MEGAGRHHDHARTTERRPGHRGEIRAVEEVALPRVDDDELVDVAVTVDIDLDRGTIPGPAARDHHEEAVLTGIDWKDVAVFGLLVRDDANAGRASGRVTTLGTEPANDSRVGFAIRGPGSRLDARWFGDCEIGKRHLAVSVERFTLREPDQRGSRDGEEARPGR